MSPEYLQAVSKSVLFAGIEAKDVPHVLSCLSYSLVHFEKNSYIVKADAPFGGVCVVADGEAAVVRETGNGERLQVNVFRVGDMFGEIIAFCGADKWPSSIQAITDCVIMFIHPEHILDMCDRACSFHKIILANLVRVVSQKAFKLNKKVEYLTIKSIAGKLSKYLLEQSDGRPTFTILLKREQLADYLNISRPSMSRELGRMRDEGIIEFYKETIRIIDMEKLISLQE